VSTALDTRKPGASKRRLREEAGKERFEEPEETMELQPEMLR
jgi:hypothetical protein